MQYVHTHETTATYIISGAAVTLAPGAVIAGADGWLLHRRWPTRFQADSAGPAQPPQGTGEAPPEALLQKGARTR